MASAAAASATAAGGDGGKRLYRSRLPDVVIEDVTFHEMLLAKAAEHGDKQLLIDGTSESGRALTGKQIVAMSAAFAAGLEGVGLKARDTIAVFSPNVPEYAVVLLGAMSLGCVVTTANPTYTSDEFAKQLVDSKAKLIVTIPMFVPTAAAAAATAGDGVSHGIYVFGEHDDAKPLASLLKNDGKYTKPTIDPAKDVCALPYSSGTTGVSKGVMLTHRNVVANCAQIRALEAPYMFANDTYFGVLPFFHIYGLVVVLALGLYAGAPIVVVPKFDFVQCLTLVQKHKISVLHIVPPIVLALAKHPVVDKFDLSSVRCLFSGAAPLSGDVEAAVRARLGAKRDDFVIKQGYGMTELAPVSHLTPTGAVRSGSVGILVPNMTARIVDPESGADVAVGERGELWLAGPNVMQGYLGRAEATAATVDADGYIHTGDIAVVDADGFFSIVDRLKELVKYKGFQVAPAELEAELLTHDAIADAAVIGVPDDEAGELPRAFVVLKAGTDADGKADAIAEYIKGRVAPHKRLRGGVVLTDAIPKSASGKILRRVLRDQCAADAKKA